jgi:hypothetical protein
VLRSPDRENLECGPLHPFNQLSSSLGSIGPSNSCVENHPMDGLLKIKSLEETQLRDVKVTCH